MLTREVVDELSLIEEESPTVVSFYLDVDGRRYATRDEVEKSAGILLRKAAKDAEQTGLLNHEEYKMIDSDLGKIDEWVRFSFQRNGARGLAVFACSGRDLFQVVPLPKSVPNAVHISRRPHVGNLVRFLDCAEVYGILLVNKESARLYRYCMGRLKEYTSILDEVPNKHHKGGWAQMRFQRHHEDHVHRHISHVASATLRFFKRERFDKLLVGATEEIWPELERTLHTYLIERMGPRLSIEVDAPEQKILDAVLEVEEAEERRREEELVSRLQEEIGREGLGVDGVDKTVQALREARAGVLLIRENTVVFGYRCPNCGYLDPNESTCPLCEREMEKVDLVEAVVDEALAQGCEVHFIPRDLASWAVSDFGALLRY